jgi:nitrilase
MPSSKQRVARYDKVHLFDVDVPGANERYVESSAIEHRRLKCR